jgi:polar amino acid transport system substrate-binding protein
LRTTTANDISTVVQPAARQRPPRRMLALLLSVVCACALLTVPATADRLDEIKARGNLILGTCYTAPPYCFREPGQSNIKGYDLDIMARVAAHLGVGIELVLVESAERIPSLEQDKIDLVATSMTRTPKRASLIEFSIPYFFAPHGVIVKKASGITSARQLAGRKVAAVKGSAVDAAVEAAIPQVKIVHFGNLAPCFDALRDDKVDAFAADMLVLRTYAKAQKDAGQYDFIPDFESRRAAGIAMKKGETGLRDAVNRALLGLEASGEAAYIYDAWFGPKSENPLPRTFRIQRE